jgi:thiol-disulfide isomerase/thioredoxin
MKKSLLGIILMLFFYAALPAQDINQMVVDERTGDLMLVGKCDRDAMLSPPFASWFNIGLQNYTPDERTINELKKHRKDLIIYVVMGTWCKDTHRQLPHFFKILDEMRYNERNLEMIAVDRNKTAGNLDISHLAITRVPTFIFIKNDLEIGRIVESPTISLEKDMLLILMQAE